MSVLCAPRLLFRLEPRKNEDMDTEILTKRTLTTRAKAYPLKFGDILRALIVFH